MPDRDRAAKILFVDDEEDVLAGIRNNLRKERKRWEMSFAVGPMAALEMVENEPFDVVISDMRMLGMDGASLLSRVREIRGEAVRIVFSGHADDEAAIRGVAVAQQWLAKPCERDQIVGAIERALVVKQLIEDVSTRVRVCGIDALPSPPTILQEIRHLVSDPKCEVSSLARTIEGDPAISAKILQLTNSAFFSFAQEVTDLTEAIPRLGLDTIAALAVSEATFRALAGDGPDMSEEVEGLQRRSLQCGRVAERIAREVALDDRSLASSSFTGALLRDVGRLVTIGTEIESECYPRIGAGLLAAWGLPTSIVDAVARHQDLSELEGEPSQSARCVHVASTLLEALDKGTDPEKIILDMNTLAPFETNLRSSDWVHLVLECEREQQEGIMR